MAADRRQVGSVVLDLGKPSARPAAEVLGWQDRPPRYLFVELGNRSPVATHQAGLSGSFQVAGLAVGTPYQPLTAKTRALPLKAPPLLEPFPRGISPCGKDKPTLTPRGGGIGTRLRICSIQAPRVRLRRWRPRYR